MTEKKSVFETLRCVDVSEHIEKKNGLSYVSWAWAWDMMNRLYPQVQVTVHEDQNGRFWFDDGRTGWVKVSATIEGQTRTEYLPVMDYRNKSIPADKITSFDANTAKQRCLVKVLALFGLGLYIYAGEDLPPDGEESKEEENPSEKAQKPAEKKDKPLNDLQATTLRKIMEKHGEEAKKVLDEFMDAMEIPKGAKLTEIQAQMLMQTFFSRGLRP